MLCNKAQQDTLAVLVTGSICIVGSSLSVVVRLASSDDSSPITIAIFAVASIDAGAALLIVFGGIVGVYVESERVRGMELHFLPYNTKGRKLMKKFWKSCQLIKIKFGASHFVEQVTPLLCMDFAISLAVQMLLLG